MRKILIMVLILILLILGYVTIWNGLDVLGMQVLSIFQIKEQSEELDQRLQEVTTLTSVDQPKAMADLNKSAKDLSIAKEEYNDKILYSSQEEIEQATQGVKYEIEYLWTKIGNYATKNGIVLKLELRQASSGVAEQYDLYFSITGSYVSISEFVAAIENDSSLNFKIENFKLEPFEQSTENLRATFTVKDIGINLNETTNSNMSQDSTSQEETTNTVTKDES